MFEYFGNLLDNISWFWLVVGLFIGWNIPQPMWVTAAQRWLRSRAKKAVAEIKENVDNG